MDYKNYNEINEITWKIIKTYFTNAHLEQLVRHQIESYNNFVNYQIQKTLEMFNPVVVRSEHDFVPECNKYSLEIFITFENFAIHRP